MNSSSLLDQIHFKPKNGRRTRLRRNMRHIFLSDRVEGNGQWPRMHQPHRSVQAVKPYSERNGIAQTLLQLPFTSNHETQNLGFRGATEAPPRPKFGCYPLNGREAGDTRECKCQSTCRPRCPPHQTIQISSMTRPGCAEQDPVDDAWERRREGRLTQLRNVLIFFFEMTIRDPEHQNSKRLATLTTLF